MRFRSSVFSVPSGSARATASTSGSASAERCVSDATVNADLPVTASVLATSPFGALTGSSLASSTADASATKLSDDADASALPICMSTRSL